MGIVSRLAWRPNGGLVRCESAWWGLFCLVCLLAPAPARAQAAPLTAISQVGRAFQACWTAPSGTEGSRITFRFGLNAKGELKGTPSVTYSQLTGDRDAQRAFVAAALLSFSRCTPLLMSPDLGRVVASRVLTITFVSRGRAGGVDI